jgi:hypothetical protein
MTVSEKVNELALKEYKVSTVNELKTNIVNIEYQKITDKYIDEAKIRIVRQKQDEANKYEPTDGEIIERLQAKLDVVKKIEE